MHYLLKHKILQFVFKYSFYISPTCFGPIGPSSGSTYQNLTKVTKITVSLKYQLKHFVKIVVAWRMKGWACGECSGCGLACDCHPTPHPLHTPQAEPSMHHTTTILTKCFNWYFKEIVILVTLARCWYVVPEDGPVGPKHVGAMQKKYLNKNCSILCFNK
jgi:hypothetical protein